MKNRNVVLLDEKLHPQTITCIETRTQFHDIKIEVCSKDEMVEKMNSKLVGIVTQYPDTEGNIIDMTDLVEATHENGGLVSVASDLLALSMIKPPGEWSRCLFRIITTPWYSNVSWRTSCRIFCRKKEIPKTSSRQNRRCFC